MINDDDDDDDGDDNNNNNNSNMNMNNRGTDFYSEFTQKEDKTSSEKIAGNVMVLQDVTPCSFVDIWAQTCGGMCLL